MNTFMASHYEGREKEQSECSAEPELSKEGLNKESAYVFWLLIGRGGGKSQHISLLVEE